jgi:Mce-associated membrane protein
MPPGGTNPESEATEAADDVVTDAAVDEGGAPTDDAVEKVDEPTETTETSEDASEPEVDPEPDPEAASVPEVNTSGTDWSRVVAYGLLPAIALLLVIAAGFLKWQDNTDRYTDVASDKSPAAEAMNTATASTITMLSYKPDSVEKQLNDARNLLTGDFRDSYTSLINDVVIPGAKQKQISAVASVPAAGVVSADPNHAVVLVFVNQTVVVGQDPPTDTASSVRVTMEKVDGRWLISEFEPV